MKSRYFLMTHIFLKKVRTIMKIPYNNFSSKNTFNKLKWGTFVKLTSSNLFLSHFSETKSKAAHNIRKHVETGKFKLDPILLLIWISHARNFYHPSSALEIWKWGNENATHVSHHRHFVTFLPLDTWNSPQRCHN